MKEYNEINNTFIKTSGGGTGTSNYNDLENKPSINNVPLIGNKTLSQLGINLNDYYTKDETYTKEEVNNLIPSTWGNWNKGQDTTGWNYMYRLDTTNMMLECFMNKTLNIGCTATSGNFFRSEVITIDHLIEFRDNLGLGRLEIYDVNINVVKSGYPIFTSFNSINSIASDFDLSFYLVSGGSRNATNYNVMVYFISSIEAY